MNLSPGSYSATIIDPAHNCSGIGPFPVTITNGNTTTLDKCLSGVARFAYVSNAVSLSNGNGNGIIEPNECNSLNVTILNDGCLVGSGVSAVLSTTTPEVTINQPNSPYPDTPENGTAVNTFPFQVSTSSSFVCGTTINFTLTVSFTGGSSVLNFSIVSCQVPPTVVNGSLDTSDPVQEGRMGRNGLVSGCGTAKACPGILGTGNRRYDVLTFPNGPGAACVTVATTATNSTAGGAIIPVAYLNTYVPPTPGNQGTICTNYLGDPGGSPAFNATNTFSVDVPANQTLVVVVQEANLGQAAGSTYTVQVSGLVGNGTGPGPCSPIANLVNAASRVTQGGAGSFDVNMPLTGPSGIEDRIVSHYTAVFTFDTPVTSGNVTVISGTATVGSITFSGNEMRADLSGVADVQNVVLHTENINGDGLPHGDVPFGFLAGDVNGNRVVDKPDINSVAANQGGVTAANFRNDVNANGTIRNNPDGKLVKDRKGHSLP